ncbi:hypothetical protein GCM10009605_62700 [Nocardiopsis composta]
MTGARAQKTADEMRGYLAEPSFLDGPQGRVKVRSWHAHVHGHQALITAVMETATLPSTYAATAAAVAVKHMLHDTGHGRSWRQEYVEHALIHRTDTD